MISGSYVWDPLEERSWGPFRDDEDAEAFVASSRHLAAVCLVKDRPFPGATNYAPSEYHGRWPL